MAYQFTQTGAEIQDILDQVPVNTSGIAALSSSMVYGGENITGGTANDTFVFWRNKGTCYSVFSLTGMLNGQPYRYGILESIVCGDEIYQLWHTQPNGAMYYRGSHSGDTAMPNWTAVATGAQVTDTIRFQNVRVTNFSIGANSSATASNTYTVPSGFTYGGIMDVWCDNTGTAGGANSSNCVCTNHWGDSTSVYAAMRNFASSAAKITVQFTVMYVRNSY